MIFTKHSLRKEFEQIGLQNTKNMWQENVLAHAHLWREVHKSNIRVTRWHTKYKILNYIMKHNFCLSDLLTKSNQTTLQSYKVEERTFGTPCKPIYYLILYYKLYIVFIFVLEIYASVNSTPPPPGY